MQRYKIILAYDGTDYAGWQSQNHCPSIAQTLQKAFYKVFKRTIIVRAISRTDAGVHALGQIAVFNTDLSIDPHAMLRAWAGKIPPDIVIHSIEQVPLDFNVHAQVAYKTYWYHVFTQRPLPFVHRYGWYFRYHLDPQKLKDALRVFEGTHDFRSFCTGNDRPDTVRTITATTVDYLEEYNAYRITIQGPKFLRYMIRRIVGACIEVASRKNLPVAYLQTILAAKNPQHTLPKAPAQGLVLYGIMYNSIVDE